MLEYRVNQGGLMRCCLETLDEMVEARDENEPFIEGETLDCKYEDEGNKNMIYEDGVWRWNK